MRQNDHTISALKVQHCFRLDDIHTLNLLTVNLDQQGGVMKDANEDDNWQIRPRTSNNQFTTLNNDVLISCAATSVTPGQPNENMK